MRVVPSIVALLLLAVPLSAQQTTPQKPPKKGDTVSVRGCLRGNAVEQAELLIEDAEGDHRRNDVVPLLTYRLQGDKKVLKELKDKHDRMVVQVKGILRSEVSGSSSWHHGRPDAHYDGLRSAQPDARGRGPAAGARRQVVRGDDGQLREVAGFRSVGRTAFGDTL